MSFRVPETDFSSEFQDFHIQLLLLFCWYFFGGYSCVHWVFKQLLCDSSQSGWQQVETSSHSPLLVSWSSSPRCSVLSRYHMSATPRDSTGCVYMCTCAYMFMCALIVIKRKWEFTGGVRGRGRVEVM